MVKFELVTAWLSSDTMSKNHLNPIAQAIR